MGYYDKLTGYAAYVLRDTEAFSRIRTPNNWSIANPEEDAKKQAKLENEYQECVRVVEEIEKTSLAIINGCEVHFKVRRPCIYGSSVERPYFEHEIEVFGERYSIETIATEGHGHLSHAKGSSAPWMPMSDLSLSLKRENAAKERDRIKSDCRIFKVRAGGEVFEAPCFESSDVPGYGSQHWALMGGQCFPLKYVSYGEYALDEHKKVKSLDELYSF
jgi:hypothetical protein